MYKSSDYQTLEMFRSLRPLWDRFDNSEELEAVNTLERELERLANKTDEVSVQEHENQS